MTRAVLTTMLLGCSRQAPDVPTGHVACPQPALAEGVDLVALESFADGDWSVTIAFDSPFAEPPPFDPTTWTAQVGPVVSARRIHRVVEGACRTPETVGVAHLTMISQDGALQLDDGQVELSLVEGESTVAVRAFATALNIPDDAVDAWWRALAEAEGQPSTGVSPLKRLYFTRDRATLVLGPDAAWFDHIPVAQGTVTLSSEP